MSNVTLISYQSFQKYSIYFFSRFFIYKRLCIGRAVTKKNITKRVSSKGLKYENEKVISGKIDWWMLFDRVEKVYLWNEGFKWTMKLESSVRKGWADAIGRAQRMEDQSAVSKECFDSDEIDTCLMGDNEMDKVVVTPHVKRCCGILNITIFFITLNKCFIYLTFYILLIQCLYFFFILVRIMATSYRSYSILLIVMASTLLELTKTSNYTIPIPIHLPAATTLST